MTVISGLWNGPGYTMAIFEGKKMNDVYWRGAMWGGISKGREYV
jgi:hypothetical protein